MRVKDLINYLGKIEPSKEIDLMINIGNSENELEDIPCSNLEIWDDGSESVTLFVSHRTGS